MASSNAGRTGASGRRAADCTMRWCRLMVDKPVTKLRCRKCWIAAKREPRDVLLSLPRQDDLFLSVLEDGLEMWSTVL